MRTVWFHVERETQDEATAARRVNRGLAIRFRDKAGNHRVQITAGDGDDLELFREGDLTFLLGRHYGLGYVSLTVFQGPEEVGSTFIQSTTYLDYIAGKDAFSRPGWWLAKVLRNAYISD